MNDPQTHWYMRLDTPTFQPAGELNWENSAFNFHLC